MRGASKPSAMIADGADDAASDASSASPASPRRKPRTAEEKHRALKRALQESRASMPVRIAQATERLQVEKAALAMRVGFLEGELKLQRRNARAEAERRAAAPAPARRVARVSSGERRPARPSSASASARPQSAAPARPATALETVVDLGAEIDPKDVAQINTALMVRHGQKEMALLKQLLAARRERDAALMLQQEAKGREHELRQALGEASRREKKLRDALQAERNLYESRVMDQTGAAEGLQSELHKLHARIDEYKQEARRLKARVREAKEAHQEPASSAGDGAGASDGEAPRGGGAGPATLKRVWLSRTDDGFGLELTDDAVVQSVTPGGEAENAQIKVGWAVVEVGGMSVARDTDVVGALSVLTKLRPNDAMEGADFVFATGGQFEPAAGGETGDAGKATYVVQFQTGDHRAAGTKKNITMRLNGSAGNSGNVLIVNDGSAFKRDASSRFTVTCDSLGEISALFVGHDLDGIDADAEDAKAAKKTRWLLHASSVTNLASGEIWRFSCGKWFGSESMVRELAPDGSDQMASESLASTGGVQPWPQSYTAELRMHCVADSGPPIELNFEAQLEGQSGASEFVQFTAFAESKSSNALQINLKWKCPEIGKVEGVRLIMVGRQDQDTREAEVYVQYVDVHSAAAGKASSLRHASTERFQAHRWLGLGGNGVLMRRVILYDEANGSDGGQVDVTDGGTSYILQLTSGEMTPVSKMEVAQHVMHNHGMIHPTVTASLIGESGETEPESIKVLFSGWATEQFVLRAPAGIGALKSVRLTMDDRSLAGYGRGGGSVATPFTWNVHAMSVIDDSASVAWFCDCQTALKCEHSVSVVDVKATAVGPAVWLQGELHGAPGQALSKSKRPRVLMMLATAEAVQADVVVSLPVHTKSAGSYAFGPVWVPALDDGALVMELTGNSAAARGSSGLQFTEAGIVIGGGELQRFKFSGHRRAKTKTGLGDVLVGVVSDFECEAEDEEEEEEEVALPPASPLHAAQSPAPDTPAVIAAAKKEAETFFDQMDPNKDGEIDQEEWSAAHPEIAWRDDFDADGDGAISRPEFIQAAVEAAEEAQERNQIGRQRNTTLIREESAFEKRHVARSRSGRLKQLTKEQEERKQNTQSVVDLMLTEKVEFADRASHAIAEDSVDVIDDVVEVLLDHDDAVLIQIEAHVDNESPSFNDQGLSQRRADAVMEALMERGVDAERLMAVGLGASKPVDTHHGQEESRNDRVEVIVLDVV